MARPETNSMAVLQPHVTDHNRTPAALLNAKPLQHCLRCRFFISQAMHGTQGSCTQLPSAHNNSMHLHCNVSAAGLHSLWARLVAQAIKTNISTAPNGIYEATDHMDHHNCAYV